MNQETTKRVLNALADGRVVNTSDSFSVSDQSVFYCGKGYGRLIVFPSEYYPFFTETSISFLLSVAISFGVSISFQSRQGLPIVELS